MTQENNVTTTEKNAFEKYADAANANRILGDILKFSDGEWLVGRDNDPLPAGTKLIADVEGLEVGWVRWADMRPAEALMGKIADGFVPCRRAELGDADPTLWPRDAQGTARDPWQFSNLLVLMDTRYRIFSFPTASKGGLGAVSKLSGSYGKHVRQAPGELPIVALHADSYKHRDRARGTIHVPVFKVIGWTDREKLDVALARAIEGRDMPDEADEPAETLPREEPAAAKKGANAYADAKGKPKPKAKSAGEDVPF
jgi:hypothetical protein